MTIPATFDAPIPANDAPAFGPEVPVQGAPPATDQQPGAVGPLAFALEYASMGFRVLPLHSTDGGGRCSCSSIDCPSPGAHPRTTSGLGDASRDPVVIGGWWDRWPQSGVAMATGEASDGMWVLAVDALTPSGGGRDGRAALRLLEEQHAPLPATLSAETGEGGLHLWWRMPAGVSVPKSRAGIPIGDAAAGLHLCATGDFVVAPSGNNSCGRPAWSNVVFPVAVAPPWLCALVAVEAVTGPDTRSQTHQTQLASAFALRERAGLAAPTSEATAPGSGTATDVAMPIAETSAPSEPRTPEIPVLLSSLTVGEAGRKLVARLDRLSRGRAGFSWPGGGTKRARPTVRKAQPGALLPPDDGQRPADWSDLHAKIGDLYADDLMVLVGSTGRGKTGFGVNYAENVATDGHPVLYMSCELGVEELAARFLAMRQRAQASESVGWASILRGGVDLDEVAQAIRHLEADCPALYLWAPAAKDRNPRALRAMVRTIADYHGGAPPLVVVDYLQRLSAAPKGGEDRRAGVATASGDLRAVSRPDAQDGYPGAAVVALSSTARGNYQHFTTANSLRVAFHGGLKAAEGPQQDTLRYCPPVELVGMGKESGEIEYDASLVLCLTCDKTSTNASSPGVLIVAKARAGTVGEVGMSFDGVRGLWTGSELPCLLEPPKRTTTAATSRQAAPTNRTGAPTKRSRHGAE